MTGLEAWFQQAAAAVAVFGLIGYLWLRWWIKRDAVWHDEADLRDEDR